MKKLLALSLSLVGAASGFATILTFENFGIPNYGHISGSYGDHAAVASTTYSIGDGLTPNVGVSYQTRATSGSVYSNYLLFWDNNYGDLKNVAFAAANGYNSVITFTPDAGHVVNLKSFDLAGWPTTNLTATGIKVVDGTGATLWSPSSLVVNGAGGTHSSYAPNVISSGPISIVWGTDWNIGIDNVNFSQTTPEPASMAALGLGALALLRKRRK